MLRTLYTFGTDSFKIWLRFHQKLTKFTKQCIIIPLKMRFNKPHTNQCTCTLTFLFIHKNDSVKTAFHYPQHHQNERERSFFPINKCTYSIEEKNLFLLSSLSWFFQSLYFFSFHSFPFPSTSFWQKEHYNAGKGGRG